MSEYDTNIKNASVDIRSMLRPGKGERTIITIAGQRYLETRVINIIEALLDGGDYRDVRCDLEDILIFIGSDITPEMIVEKLNSK